MYLLNHLGNQYRRIEYTRKLAIFVLPNIDNELIARDRGVLRIMWVPPFARQFSILPVTSRLLRVQNFRTALGIRQWHPQNGSLFSRPIRLGFEPFAHLEGLRWRFPA
eukprot:scaffold198234_cov36-Tisochrysis_lutea.AAC.2